MQWKANDLIILLIIFAALIFFGTAVWMIVQNVTSERVRWIFDILSAFLFLSVFFWLFVWKDSVKSPPSSK